MIGTRTGAIHAFIRPGNFEQLAQALEDATTATDKSAAETRVQVAWAERSASWQPSPTNAEVTALAVLVGNDQDEETCYTVYSGHKNGELHLNQVRTSPYVVADESATVRLETGPPVCFLFASARTSCSPPCVRIYRRERGEGGKRRKRFQALANAITCLCGHISVVFVSVGCCGDTRTESLWAVHHNPATGCDSCLAYLPPPSVSHS